MKPGLLACACATVLFSSIAAAQTATAQRPQIGGHGNDVAAFIAQHDDNADGRLTWAEFENFRHARYHATDANGDGSVDEAEYVAEFQTRWKAPPDDDDNAQARQLRQTKVRFAALDADKDGKLSYGEYQASGRRLFDRADRNGDGNVDAADAALPPKEREPRTDAAARD